MSACVCAIISATLLSFEFLHCPEHLNKWINLKTKNSSLWVVSIAAQWCWKYHIKWNMLIIHINSQMIQIFGLRMETACASLKCNSFSLSLFLFFLTTRHPIISVKRFFFPASIITAAWVLWRLNNAQGKSSKWPACPAYVNYTGYIEKWLSHVYTQRSCSVTEIHEASRAFFSFFFF